MGMSNKDRLYVCLFARSGGPKMPGLEDTYHWALMVGPKIEDSGKRGIQYHAKENLGPNGFEWVFEKKEVSLEPANMILVRIMVAKIMDRGRLDELLSQVPIRADIAGWNCVGWVKESLQVLEQDDKVLGTHTTAWDAVRDGSMRYCQQKKDEGRFTPAKYNPQKIPTFDLMGGREVIQ